MATPKKIFFSYSNQEEDLQLYTKINRHFAGYSRIGLVGIIDRAELFRTTSDREQALEQIRKADLAVPLLSIDYVTDEECLQQLEKAASSQVKIVPVLLRDFDWEAHQNITRYKSQMLPDDLSPVEKHITEDQNDDTVFKEIAQSVKAIILPEIGSMEFQKPAGTFLLYPRGACHHHRYHRLGDRIPGNRRPGEYRADPFRFPLPADVRLHCPDRPQEYTLSQ